MFLTGKSDALIQELTRKMETKAEEHNFEQAAQVRDQIIDLRRIYEQQYVAGQGSDADVLAIACSAAYVCVHIIFIRAGRIICFEEAARNHGLMAWCGVGVPACHQEKALWPKAQRTPLQPRIRCRRSRCRGCPVSDDASARIWTSSCVN